jgi:hypothetical protein
MCEKVESAGASNHLELAEKFLAEGRELIDKDPVQASEKLYKAAEEAVKAIAITLNIPEARKAIEKGKWTTELLFDAVDDISAKLGEDIRRLWHTAWFLHVEGFHEARLRREHVAVRYRDIEVLVDLVKKIVQEGLQ